MGFGTLFIGYFLLLNVTFYLYTDLIATLVMALGLYKLSTVNRPFKWAFYTSIAFAIIGAFELVVQFISTFGIDADALTVYSAIPRELIISTLSVFILMGIAEVSEEVGLSSLRRRARITIPFVPVIYMLYATLEFPMLQKVIEGKVLAVLSFITLLLTFTLVIVNLVTIYTAYMRICMPEEKDMDAPAKPSKFGFVNKYREHNERKSREYAEYKLNKMIENNKKNAKKKKKK